jgi:hypothetical protein
VLQGSETSNTNLTESLQYVGGYYSIGANEYHHGYVDELRVTKGVARYTANFTPPTEPFNPRTPDDPLYANVSLLLPMDGANGSTTFVDRSPTTKAVSAFGNAQISTAQSKFGGASGFFDGTGDYLSVSPAISFASGDFTAEYWVYFTSTLSQNPVLSRRSGSNGYWLSSGYSTGNLRVVWQQWTAGGAYNFVEASPAHALNTWVHVAFVRFGNDLTIYTDGVSRASVSTVNRPGDPGSVSHIAQDEGAPGATLNGYLDDLRITNGLARYTANFTPPTRSGFSTSSLAVGAYEITTAHTGECNVVCLDDAAGTVYNDLILRTTPV